MEHGRHIPYLNFVVNINSMAHHALTEAETVVLVTPLPLPVEEERKNGLLLRNSIKSELYCKFPEALRIIERTVVCDLYQELRKQGIAGDKLGKLFVDAQVDCK
jgi:hypothetical protein